MKCGMDHSIPTSEPGYPVGRCTDPGCHYREPHRHGFACEKTCACEGVGAETEPLGEDDLATCDWGHCDRESAAMRRCVGEPDPLTGEDQWLAVCSWHAGWDDYESETTND